DNVGERCNKMCPSHLPIGYDVKGTSLLERDHFIDRSIFGLLKLACADFVRFPSFACLFEVLRTEQRADYFRPIVIGHCDRPLSVFFGSGLVRARQRQATQLPNPARTDSVHLNFSGDGVIGDRDVLIGALMPNSTKTRVSCYAVAEAS